MFFSKWLLWLWQLLYTLDSNIATVWCVPYCSWQQVFTGVQLLPACLLLIAYNECWNLFLSIVIVCSDYQILLKRNLSCRTFWAFYCKLSFTHRAGRICHASIVSCQIFEYKFIIAIVDPQPSSFAAAISFCWIEYIIYIFHFSSYLFLFGMSLFQRRFSGSQSRICSLELSNLMSLHNLTYVVGLSWISIAMITRTYSSLCVCNWDCSWFSHLYSVKRYILDVDTARRALLYIQ